MARRAGTAMVALLACCSVASALTPTLAIDQYAHTAWTVRDGFFKGSVSAIAQTPDGYLWLGTEFGLLRFDGVRAVSWEPPAGQHLLGGYVRALLAARDGRLWIATNSGLASWKDGKLIQYPEVAGLVGSLIEDHEGTIWVSESLAPTGRLCAIQSGKVKCYGEDGSFGNYVVPAYEDSRGNLWVGSSTGLWRWKPGPPKLYPLPDLPQGLLEGDHGAILISAQDGIKQLVNGKIEPYPLPGAMQKFRPRALFRDRNGGLWIGTADRGVLHVHHGNTDALVRADGLSGDNVGALFEDREGNIWAATNDGLDRFRDFAVPKISVEQGLSNANVGSVLAGTDGSVWLGTPDGLNRWEDGKVTIYRKRNGLPDDSIESLFEDESGRIWVSTPRGVAYFENGRFVPVRGLPGGRVHSIAGDRAGNLWINYELGLFHLIGGNVIEQIPWASLGRKGLAMTLLSDATGGLWIGFLQGGVEYFKDGKVRVSYSSADGLGQGLVAGLQLDGDGTLWAATEGGLSRVKKGRATTLTTENGLPCDSVHWLIEDDDHAFWLGMACGLVRVPRRDIEAWFGDPKRTVTARLFDTSDGVRTRSFSGGYSPLASKSPDGKLWFWTPNGLSVVDPRHLPFNKLPPPLHIEQIIADRKTYETSPNLSLPALTRDLEIDYTALSLVAPEKNRFRVKLEGWDRDWKDAGNERKAFYSNLPPRHYRFRVAASNNSGVWNEAGASFNFSITPAYYQTTWFRASCGVAFLALLWGLYRYRLHQIAREFNMRLDERVGERTRLARDLHDTLLQGFQGLMLRLQALDDLLPQGEAKEELEQTLDRADQVVTESRKAVHDLRLSTTVTNDLARAVRALGDELSAEHSATFGFLLEGHAQELHPIVRDEVYRITREALRNAFKHARARHIEAEIIYAENLFRLRIRDDGAGIAPAILEDGRPGHYGLPGMRERAADIGAKLDIWSGAGAGTEIDLSIAGSIAYGKPPGRSQSRVFRAKAE